MNELEIIRHERIPGLTAFFNTVDYRTPHFHPEWELMWLLDHPLTVSRGGGSFRAEKGSLLLFQPNEPHELHMIDEKCTFLCLQVSPELLRLDSDLVVEDILLNPYLGGWGGAGPHSHAGDCGRLPESGAVQLAAVHRPDMPGVP